MWGAKPHKHMNSAFVASVETNIHWASDYRWAPGQTLCQSAGAYALWLVLEGCVEVTVDGQLWRVPKDFVLLSRPGERDIATPQGARWLSVGLRANAFGKVDIFDLLDPPLLWQPDASARRILSGWMKHLARHLNPTEPARDTANDLMCDGLARAITGLCWRMKGNSDLGQAAQHTLPSYVALAMERMKHEPHISIGETARGVGLSPAQFRRSFHQWVGTSPRDFLKLHRLRTARHLLESGDLPIAAIARRLGFKSTSHFIRLWHRTHGTSPAAFRALAGEPKV